MATITTFQQGTAGERNLRQDGHGNVQKCNLSPGTTLNGGAIGSSSLANAGDGTTTSLVNDGTGPELALKGVKGGPSVLLSNTATAVTFATTSINENASILEDASTGDRTYTAAEFVPGTIINITGLTSNSTRTLPTVAALLALVPKLATTNCWYQIPVHNASGQTVSWVASAGWTLRGVSTAMAVNTTAVMTIVVTDAGTPTATFFRGRS